MLPLDNFLPIVSSPNLIWYNPSAPSSTKNALVSDLTFKNVECNYGGGSGSAILASNGVRVVMIDCTIEYANSVISASHGLFGFGNFAYSGNPSHDNSDHLFGTDIRAVGSIFRDISDEIEPHLVALQDTMDNDVSDFVVSSNVQRCIILVFHLYIQN